MRILGKSSDRSICQFINRRFRARIDHDFWRAGFDQLSNAIRIPIESNALSRIVKRPISVSLVPELYDYDAFLRGLGRMSLSKFLLDVISMIEMGVRS